MHYKSSVLEPILAHIREGAEYRVYTAMYSSDTYTLELGCSGVPPKHLFVSATVFKMIVMIKMHCIAA